MKKVSIVAPFEVNGRFAGGINFVASNVYKEKDVLLHNGFELHKINTCYVNRDKSKNGKLCFGNVRNMVHLVKVCRRETTGSDIVYYHTSRGLALLKDLMVAANIKRKNKSKILLHIHYAEYSKIMTGNQFIDKIIHNLLKEYIDKIIFLSKNTRDEFVQRGISVDKTEIVYNFFEQNYSDEVINIKLNRETDRINLIFMGSIDQRKGIIDLLNAMKDVSSGAVLDVCGIMNDIGIETEFEDLVANLGDKVRLHGYVSGEKKRELLFEADALILPSYAEGLPITIMEAFAAGCAVITTNVGAIPEIFDETNGFMLNPGDIKGISEAIKELCGTEKLRKIQKYNFEYSQKFTLAKYMQELAAVLKAL